MAEKCTVCDHIIAPTVSFSLLYLSDVSASYKFHLSFCNSSSAFECGKTRFLARIHNLMNLDGTEKTSNFSSAMNSGIFI